MTTTQRNLGQKVRAIRPDEKHYRLIDALLAVERLVTEYAQARADAKELPRSHGYERRYRDRIREAARKLREYRPKAAALFAELWPESQAPKL